MGWFEEQIKQRKQLDDDLLTDSFINIAGAVMGTKVQTALSDDRIATQNAVEEILKYYHKKACELPDTISDINEQIEYIMRPHGFMRRSVKLTEGWYNDAIGAMLGVMKEDSSVVALIPNGISGYCYVDNISKKKIKITAKNAHLLEEEAIAFYKPFPLKKMGISTLIRYMFEALRMSDIVMIIGAALVVTLVGLLTPILNNIIMSDVVESGNMQLFYAITIFLVCVTISNLLFASVQALVTNRISTKMSVQVEAGAMMRILALPARFFTQYSSGDLSSRVSQVSELSTVVVNAVFSTGITSLMSLMYLGQIYAFAPSLVAPALMIISLTVVLSIATALIQMGVNRKKMMEAGVESGVSYAMISGVQKIKVSGAEKRAFAKWGNTYAKVAELTYNPPLFLKINTVLSTAITLLGTIVLYYVAIQNQVSVADYYSFTTAYAMLSAAFMGLTSLAVTAATIKPTLERVAPILEAVPEISEGKQVVTRISGGIELNQVSFRYNENAPVIIDELSLKIRAGQYVAIVGKTGCGKSTLIRLLLGFETPQKGSIYYDGKDMTSMDLKSLRRKIGTVTQNGKLFGGDIYSNITISAPWLGMEEAREAADIAGILEDIDKMPMGMGTLISEGAGGVSGGQRQRLMIARAIAPKPKLLIFDEATSALDNMTQKKVSESLDKLRCTRIVVAHRLSTIKHCDRIIYLDKGKIIEDGTYEDLIAQNGAFAELVKRQQLETT